MNLSKSKKKIIIIISAIILIVIISLLSYTYAYFSFSNNDNNAITGNATKTEIQLTVEKIVPTANNSDLKLIPLLNDAVSNAVAGIGGNSSCIDANGNLSCQTYKITIENTGSSNLKLKGTIELTASGTNNIFSNLKWQELENSTTTKASSPINSMGTSTLVESLDLNPGSKKEYYFVLWISEVNRDQSGEDYGNFRGTVAFNDSNGQGLTATFNS